MKKPELWRSHWTTGHVRIEEIRIFPRQLTKNPLSNNVGGVNHFSSTLLHALGKERHFALVDGLRFPTWARF